MAPGIQPASVAQRLERGLGKAAAVGRVEEGDVVGVARRHEAELARVAPEDAGGAAEAQRLDVGADQGTRFRAVVDEQREARAARQRLERERAGAGEEIDDAQALDAAMAVLEDVEQGLP